MKPAFDLFHASQRYSSDPRKGTPPRRGLADEKSATKPEPVYLNPNPNLKMLAESSAMGPRPGLLFTRILALSG